MTQERGGVSTRALEDMGWRARPRQNGDQANWQVCEDEKDVPGLAGWTSQYHPYTADSYDT